jgi:MFS family permease
VTLAEYATQRTFRSLRVRNYRLFFFGQLVSVSGTWMQQLAQDWLVLKLTNQPLPVGVTTALQFAPVLAFGAWGGAVADRLDKRRLLLTTQATMGSLALVLGTLTALGQIRLWMVYGLALLLGCATAFDMPTRQAFVTEMVGPEYLTNAVGLNSAVFNSARVIGPAAAGVLIAAVGLAPAFLLNAASYLAVIGGLWAMDPERLYRRRPAVERSRGQVRAGLRYVLATPALRSTILLVAVIGTLGLNYRVALPLLARFTFHGGPSAYGTLASIMAVRRNRPTRLLLLGSGAAFGVLSLAAAFAPSLAAEAVVLAPLGLSSIGFITTANVTLQLGSDAAMRGRVMSLYGLVFLGSTPVGSVLVGWMAGRFGPRSGLVLGGVSTLLAIGLAAVAAARRRGEPLVDPVEDEPVVSLAGGRGGREGPAHPA